MMKKIGISAPFDFKGMYHGGQCVKAREVYSAFCDKYEKENVEILETYHDKNYIKLLFKSFLMIKNCERVAMLPAHNGVKIFAPLYAFLNKIFKRKLYYFVVGGWLPEYIEENKFLKKPLKKFDAIFVETNIMKEKLENQGFENVFYFPNFRQMEILKEDELVYSNSEPFKLCTFSRIIKEKGIEDAIKSVTETNEKIGKDAFNLDIYGVVDDDYKEEFENILKNSPSYIEYKGCVKPENATCVLKDYFALLFPTYYNGEGLAGTLIDAFASGVPVIATNWRYNSEIVKDGFTGIVYNYEDKKLLNKALYDAYLNVDKFNLMKFNCIMEAEKYTKQTALKILEKYL
ncbi:MAG: glycosyltransferase [Ruminococcaceae bacterium]|nr:glycosyltransferase [Oscillospiraceae bacterium]